MAYASRADLEQMYGTHLLAIIADLTQDGIPEDDAIAAALEEASSEIDTYIALLYAVPVEPAPKILTQLARDMAIYRLSLQAGPRTTEMRTRYEDALKLLERIAAGKASLPIPKADGDANGDGDVDDDDAALAEALKRPFLIRTVRT